MDKTPSKTSQYFLGVDTGATKSHALIADENGRPVGFGEGGPGNWESVGWDGARRMLKAIICQALTQAGIEQEQIAGAGFGLAGYDWPEDRPPHLDIIREVGLTAPFQLVNDALIGLPAGAEAGWGVVVSAGTSCNCYGRGPQGEIGRVTGSHNFGENAGAMELVWHAVQSVAHAWTQRGPTTRLTDIFLEVTGARDAADLLAGLMRGRYAAGADYAPLVFQAASAGDATAIELMAWAGRELGLLANSVIRQLNIAEMAFDVVLSGSFFKGSPLIKRAMAETIHAA
ncbi:MAG: N-acetylglucosamine kinase, partial [Anaerolineae bacterium]